MWASVGIHPHEADTHPHVDTAKLVALLAGTPQELARHRCIVIRENNATFNHWQLTDGHDKVMVKVNGPLSTNHGEIAVDWALAGHGIVLRSEWDVAAYLRQGQLCRVLAPWAGEAADIVTKGRHDPCVGIRGAPVVEAMMALVLADHKLLHRAQNG